MEAFGHRRASSCARLQHDWESRGKEAAHRAGVVMAHGLLLTCDPTSSVCFVCFITRRATATAEDTWAREEEVRVEKKFAGQRCRDGM